MKYKINIYSAGAFTKRSKLPDLGTESQKFQPLLPVPSLPCPK